MIIPKELEQITADLFAALPLEKAMPELVVKDQPTARGADSYENAEHDAHALASNAIDKLEGHPALQSALWLYVDDLEQSHRISQAIQSPIGSYLHGVMHRREGDFSNSKYWFRQAGNALDGFEPDRFVDQVERENGNSPELLKLQRQEWAALFEACAADLEKS